MQPFRIALAGNPNSGKTTIYNALTGTRQHVGNYAGVTVERKTGRLLIDGLDIEVVDLPGIYSLSSSSIEGKVAAMELHESKIDLILNVLDAGNLQRNLYLTTQLGELGIPMLMVFNMADDAKKRGFVFDIAKLQRFFGAPIVETIGHTEQGIDELTATIAKMLRGELAIKRLPFRYNKAVDEAIESLTDKIAALDGKDEIKVPPRYLAIKLLENDSQVMELPFLEPLLPEVNELNQRLNALTGLESDILMADCRYGLIAGACREAVAVKKNNRREISDSIDKVVTSRLLGVPIFLVIMFLVFAFTFNCGAPLCDLIEQAIGSLADAIDSLWSDDSLPFLKSLVINGIIGGVGGVLMFLPNLLLLFTAIAFLEGTGYMNRAAFVMDGFMHRFGLHGKSFIPMLLGFGCTVPAVMATRTIESHKDRLTTIMVLPLMSCGARLPIYTLFIPALFKQPWRPVVLWSLYIIGIVISLIAARVLKSTLFKGDDEVFVMELPPYRMPTLKGILFDLGERTMVYLQKAGTIILAASIILFIVNSLPVKPGCSRAELAKVKETQGAEAYAKLRLEAAQYTIGGRIGFLLAKPMSLAGFQDKDGNPDWKGSSALIGAFAAKELFVSQLAILNSVDDYEDNGITQLKDKLARQYTPLSGFCIMLYCLIAMPCIGTVAVVKRETNSWTFALAQLAGLTFLAWLSATLVFQIGSLF